MGVAWLGVPAVVMTLGMNGVLQGLSLGLSKGLTCRVVRVVRARSRCGICSSARVLGIPTELFVWVGVALFVTVLLTLTTFGRRVYAVGVNPRAAFLSGRRRARRDGRALHPERRVRARWPASPWSATAASPRSASATRTCSSPSPPSSSAECPFWAVGATTSAWSPVR